MYTPHSMAYSCVYLHTSHMCTDYTWAHTHPQEATTHHRKQRNTTTVNHTPHMPVRTWDERPAGIKRK